MNKINERSQPDKQLVQDINAQLIDHFGRDIVTNLPIWRVSWAPEQFEKRYGIWNDYSGDIFIRSVKEAREVCKYPHLQQHYVLERLVQVPEFQQEELCGAKISYEPIHPFWDKNTDYLPPNFVVAKFIVDTIYAAMGKASMHKYIDPDADGNNGLEAKKERVKVLIEGLYGNDTRITDALGTGSAVFIDSTKKVN